jgi:hypothetical protein
MKIWQPLAFVALFFSAAASAQIGSGQSGMSTSTPLTNVRAFDELSALGVCLAKTQRRDALAAIATVPGSKEEDKFFQKFFYGERTTCLFGGTRMSMPIIFARGAIAEGLLRSKGVPAEYILSAPAPADTRNLHEVARCYTSGHRTEVEALLKTDAGSPEEVKAVAAQWEDFRTCMPGFKVRLNAPWIRFLLAEALLRLAPDTTISGD